MNEEVEVKYWWQKDGQEVEWCDGSMSMSREEWEEMSEETKNTWAAFYIFVDEEPPAGMKWGLEKV